ncbi:MAG: lysine-2,3-aminomutase-like protein [Paracoccaceae bacterium]
MIPAEAEDELRSVADAFRIRVTPAMQRAIQTPDDPVARQFVPTRAEAVVNDTDLHDPIGDRVHLAAPGLTHRYPDRVILALTQTCDVYCRFCFRRETVGASGTLSADELDQALDYLARTPAVREVVMTGGDPLTLSPRRIGAVLDRLAAIPHIEHVRFHSRVPVVAPDRIDPQMVQALGRHPVVWVVVHTNHAQELTEAARAALARLTAAGIPLLSQTVLLKGVNDSAATLADLFRALVRLKVKPYYLHHCDLARGAGHFRTTIAQGRAIMAELRGMISGLCIPTYVLDTPGGFGKVPLTQAYVTETAPGHWSVRDHAGRLHDYRDPA